MDREPHTKPQTQRFFYRVGYDDAYLRDDRYNTPVAGTKDEWADYEAGYTAGAKERIVAERVEALEAEIHAADRQPAEPVQR